MRDERWCCAWSVRRKAKVQATRGLKRWRSTKMGGLFGGSEGEAGGDPADGEVLDENWIGDLQPNQYRVFL